MLCITLPCIGQLVQQDRFELALDGREGLENPQVTALGKEGALIHRRIKGSSQDFLELIKIDTTLRENWRGVITLDRNLVISLVVSRDQIMYFLLRSVAYGNFDFTVIAMNIATSAYNTYLVKNLIPLNPSEMNISANAILIGGYFNFRPVVLHFSFESGRSRLLPGFFNEEGELNQIKTYPDGLIDIIVSSRGPQRKKVLWIRSYTPEGELIQASMLQGDNDKNLIVGKSFRKSDGTQLIAGSFGVRNVEYSRGIFMAELKPEGEQSIRYYNFSDFENFFKYMKPRREGRLKGRIEKRKEKGKKNRQSYRFLTNEINQYGNEILLLGEAYYPRYLYSNNYGYSLRGDRVFDGYRYTHAAVFGFDLNGNLKWDNQLEMNDIKTFSLNQFVKLMPKDNELGMIYLYDNTLRSKTINRNQVIQGKTKTALMTEFETDEVKEKDTESSALTYWYDPYFIAHGIQYVRNSKNGRNNVERRVLFIVKLKYQ